MTPCCMYTGHTTKPECVQLAKYVHQAMVCTCGGLLTPGTTAQARKNNGIHSIAKGFTLGEDRVHNEAGDSGRG